jgi:hypothetical protein
VSSITDDEFGGFRITIPPLYQWRGWTAAFVVASFVLFAAVRGSSVKMILISFPACLLIGYNLINTLAIRRVVAIDGKNLVLASELAGFRKVKTFELARVRNLRPVVRSLTRGSSEGTPVANSVVFEYGGRCYHFGTGLSEEEVLRLVRTIRDRYRIKDHVDDVEPLPVLR